MIDTSEKNKWRAKGCRVLDGPYIVCICDTEAKARIIAAAPELLAALRGLVDAVNDHIVVCPDFAPDLDAAYAALDAAEGE